MSVLYRWSLWPYRLWTTLYLLRLTVAVYSFIRQMALAVTHLKRYISASIDNLPYELCTAVYFRRLWYYSPHTSFIYIACGKINDVCRINVVSSSCRLNLFCTSFDWIWTNIKTMKIAFTFVHCTVQMMKKKLRVNVIIDSLYISERTLEGLTRCSVKCFFNNFEVQKGGGGGGSGTPEQFRRQLRTILHHHHCQQHHHHQHHHHLHLSCIQSSSQSLRQMIELLQTKDNG